MYIYIYMYIYIIHRCIMVYIYRYIDIGMNKEVSQVSPWYNDLTLCKK